MSGPPENWIGSWPDYDHDDRCPSCGDKVEGLANARGMDRPKPGDACICIWCMSVNVMGIDGKIRLPTDGEAMRFAHDPELARIQAAMRELGPPKRGRKP